MTRVSRCDKPKQTQASLSTGQRGTAKGREQNLKQTFMLPKALVLHLAGPQGQRLKTHPANDLKTRLQ